jgi:hypothetical protein
VIPLRLGEVEGLEHPDMSASPSWLTVH